MNFHQGCKCIRNLLFLIVKGKKLKKELKTIVFDLGDVILNLDFKRAIESFRSLGCKAPEEFYNKQKQYAFFEELETGSISEEEFRTHLRKWTAPNTADTQIDTAWNSLIVDIPNPRMELIRGLKKQYQLILLSNTNSIHMRFFKGDFAKDYINWEFFDLFDVTYLSHEVGLRKPNPAIFRKVLDENKLNPHETLFIDDSKSNIDAASLLGIQTLWLQDHQELTDELPSFLTQFD